MTPDEFGENGAQRAWAFDKVHFVSESSSVEALMAGIPAMGRGHGDDKESAYG